MRIGEHKYTIQRGNIMSNAIAVHEHETDHPIDWASARVIERGKYFSTENQGISSHKCSVNCISKY